LADAAGNSSASSSAPSGPVAEKKSDLGPSKTPFWESSEVLKQKLREEEQKSGAQLLSEEIPPPPGVDKKLWKVFLGELHDLAERLRQLLDQTELGPQNDSLITETLRTLHTMKSAAMVVPVEPVVRLVHLIEGSVIRARDEDLKKWPQAQLRWFQEWVHQLLTPGNDPNAILQAAARLEQEMAS